MRRYGIRDDQWERIRDLLPGQEGHGSDGGRQPGVRRGGAYRYRTGMPWRDLPELVTGRTHQRFSRWAKSGVWEKVFLHLSADADNEYAMIDSTIVRAHQHSAGAQKSRRGPGDRPIARGLSTKIHALADALGNPVSFFLTGGEAYDLVGADHLLLDASRHADRHAAPDADERVIAPLAAAGKTAVIPPKATGDCLATTTNTSTRRVTSSRTSSPNSSSSVPSPPATTRPRATSSPPST